MKNQLGTLIGSAHRGVARYPGIIKISPETVPDRVSLVSPGYKDRLTGAQANALSPAARAEHGTSVARSQRQTIYRMIDRAKQNFAATCASMLSHRAIESGNLKDVDMERNSTMPAVLVTRDTSSKPVEPSDSPAILKIVLGVVVFLFVLLLFRH